MYILCYSTIFKIILESNSFRSNIRSDSPKWLQKWCALVLRVIDEEHCIFLEELIQTERKKITKDSSSVEIDLSYLKCLAQSRKDARIQNIVISIDKIKYYVNMIKDETPPLLDITKEVFKYISFSKAFKNIIQVLLFKIIDYNFLKLC